MSPRARILLAPLAVALVLALGATLPSTSATGALSVGCNPTADVLPSILSKRNARGAVECLINLHRTRAGLKPLRRNRRLSEAAQRHTRRMRASCFGHQCSGERSLKARLRAVGYLNKRLRSYYYSENIAWGSGVLGTPRRIVDAWMRSAGHRANILSPQVRDIGVGYVRGRPSNARGDGGLYTADFGFRRRR